MKYVLIVGDGMADLPIPALNGHTPLSYLSSDGFAAIAGGVTGRFKSCPDSLPPGSDVAFLSLLGNDTSRIYTGRSPLEAAGMGIALQPGEVAFRMNLVALSGEGYPQGVMLSHNGGGIDGAPAFSLVTDLMRDKAFSKLMDEFGLRIYPTDTFRHIAVMPGCAEDFSCTPPHDLAAHSISGGLPGGARGAALQKLMEASFDVLSRHPINEARRAEGLYPANSAWFWGAGTACVLPNFEEKYAKRGVVVSAVPLVKGIALLNCLTVPAIEGATGLLDTNYEGKVEAALDALENGYDFALVHLEAPDEMSHDGDLERKLEAIRRVDMRVVQPLLRRLPELGDHRVMILADHYTLLSTRTHDGTPVPFAIYDSRRPGIPRPFSEALCGDAPIIESGDALMRLFFE